MTRTYDARSQDARCPPPAPEAAAAARAVPPAETFAQLAARLHAGGPVQRIALTGPTRDFSGITGPGRPPRVSALPGGLRAQVEARSGLPMGDVRVHRDSPEPSRLGALAYARGRDIHLAPGQERHLPHEAWHVVQQKQGRVRPTLRMNGIGINTDAGVEREADAARSFGASRPGLAGSDPAGRRARSAADLARAPIQMCISKDGDEGSSSNFSLKPLIVGTAAAGVVVGTIAAIRNPGLLKTGFGGFMRASKKTNYNTNSYMYSNLNISSPKKRSKSLNLSGNAMNNNIGTHLSSTFGLLNFSIRRSYSTKSSNFDAGNNLFAQSENDLKKLNGGRALDRRQKTICSRIIDVKKAKNSKQFVKLVEDAQVLDPEVMYGGFHAADVPELSLIGDDGTMSSFNLTPIAKKNARRNRRLREEFGDKRNIVNLYAVTISVDPKGFTSIHTNEIKKHYQSGYMQPAMRVGAGGGPKNEYNQKTISHRYRKGENFNSYAVNDYFRTGYEQGTQGTPNPQAFAHSEIMMASDPKFGRTLVQAYREMEAAVPLNHTIRLRILMLNTTHDMCMNDCRTAVGGSFKSLVERMRRKGSRLRSSEFGSALVVTSNKPHQESHNLKRLAHRRSSDPSAPRTPALQSGKDKVHLIEVTSKIDDSDVDERKEEDTERSTVDRRS